ncbi:D-aminoacyl-tRNA deacylase [uncultured Boseongicola sp.]|uniref:D-aminoacyl-tRNA deacylase n=1 Tax=uncultured Boseongicola sp. TaxID=1648499 RepID=UPI0026312BC2|nr:D-aminoacyl-tRNA deacylase [uncultured Boseongicola sp.]
MRALVQRVSRAEVRIEGDVVGAIEDGVLIFVCAMVGDPPNAPEKLAAKIAKLRIFRDDDGRMNRSLLDVGGSALVVSQFTLAADTRRGNRPGFSSAAPPDEGEIRYLEFVSAVMDLNIPVATGTFGADMAVALVNDGPVTIWVDTDG